MSKSQDIADALSRAIESQIHRVGSVRMQVITETPSQFAIDVIDALAAEGYRIVPNDEVGDA